MEVAHPEIMLSLTTMTGITAGNESTKSPPKTADPKELPRLISTAAALLSGMVFCALKTSFDWNMVSLYGQEEHPLLLSNALTAVAFLPGVILASSSFAHSRLRFLFISALCAAALASLLDWPSGTWTITAAGISYLSATAAAAIYITSVSGPGSAGLFFLGACAAALTMLSPASTLLDQLPLAWLYILTPATFFLISAYEPAPTPSRPSPSGIRTFAGAAILSAWFAVSQYMTSIANGQASSLPFYVILTAGLAIAFIPELKRRLSRAFAAACTAVAIILLFSNRDPSPALFGLIAFQSGNRLLWEGAGPVSAALGAMAGAVAAWLTIPEIAPAIVTAPVTAYAVYLPFMWAWVLMSWRYNITTRSSTTFGHYSVRESHFGERFFFHGDINHGGEKYYGEGVPNAYSRPGSPAFTLFRERPFKKVAMLGLGSGSLCYYARPGETWAIYELDPEVIRLAWEEFSFLKQCKAETRIIAGDALKNLNEAPDGEYDLLFSDIYSGKRIPSEYLTDRAFDLYFKKTAHDGVIAIHASGNEAVVLKALRNLAVKNGLWILQKKTAPWREMRSSIIAAGRSWDISKDLKTAGWTS